MQSEQDSSASNPHPAKQYSSALRISPRASDSLSQGNLQRRCDAPRQESVSIAHKSAKSMLAPTQDRPVRTPSQSRLPIAPLREEPHHIERKLTQIRIEAVSQRTEDSGSLTSRPRESLDSRTRRDCSRPAVFGKPGHRVRLCIEAEVRSEPVRDAVQVGPASCLPPTELAERPIRSLFPLLHPSTDPRTSATGLLQPFVAVSLLCRKS
jgi:hypothetical protein